MNTIAEKWNQYEGLFHEKAGEVQRKETKRAFYAGAMAFMVITMRIGEKEISEEAGCAMMMGLEEELKLFAKQVIKGEV